jgi:hypothetical protein
VNESLVGSGRVARIGSFELGPRLGDTRRVEIEWTDPRVDSAVEPSVRRLSGDWHRHGAA